MKKQNGHASFGLGSLCTNDFFYPSLSVLLAAVVCQREVLVVMIFNRHIESKCSGRIDLVVMLFSRSQNENIYLPNYRIMQIKCACDINR